MINESLAEFTGALAGDGCLSKYFAKSEKAVRYEVAFTGSIDDFSYYKETLQPILYQTFGVKGRLFLRGNSTRFHIKNKAVFGFFANLGVPIGVKGKNISIPAQILNEASLTLAFIRGLWNTDGSIYRRYNKMYAGHSRIYSEYLVMQLKLNSKLLLVQVKAALSSIGIETTKIAKEKNAFVLRIGRQEAIQKYLKLIGFSNKHHLKRIGKLRAHGGSAYSATV